MTVRVVEFFKQLMSEVENKENAGEYFHYYINCMIEMTGLLLDFQQSGDSLYLADICFSPFTATLEQWVNSLGGKCVGRPLDDSIISFCLDDFQKSIGFACIKPCRPLVTFDTANGRVKVEDVLCEVGDENG